MSVTCPKCKSNSITAQKQGFGFGKALIGGLLTGAVGLFAGAINKNKIYNHCLNCGYKWEPIFNKQHNIKELQSDIEDKIESNKSIPTFSKEDYNKEVFNRTGLSASDPKFTKLGKNKKRK